MEEKEPIVSKCGYRCDLCPAHESNLKSEADKKTMCDAWNKYLGGNIEPEAISVCGGCQAEGKQGDESCPVRPCAIGRGVETCAHCEEFACEKVKSKMNFVEESVKDVSNIPQSDFKKFIEPFFGGRHLSEIRESLKK
ncbi:MAG: DUF3795 domain-containing protein [Planctomycetota bacterium]|jgi:hypothetical protein